MQDIKKIAKKVWHFIWEEDSIWSWIVNVILAFLIIKYLVYPGLGLALHTSHPVVAVVSGSMEHDGSFDDWWDSQAICNEERFCKQKDWYAEYNITKETFKEFPFKNGFNKGDIMVLYGTKPKDIKRGDILIFDINKAVPIIHRVVNEWDEDNRQYFTTKGDHNPDIYPEINEAKINQEQILGKAVLRIPWLGYIKIWFVELLRLLHIIR
ncbi:signal peptidase I [Candidatus Woesearchaeota archaeon]|nr:signal peptidase I [Candidatus Woesearchaeota archaeon]